METIEKLQETIERLTNMLDHERIESANLHYKCRDLEATIDGLKLEREQLQDARDANYNAYLKTLQELEKLQGKEKEPAPAENHVWVNTYHDAIREGEALKAAKVRDMEHYALIEREGVRRREYVALHCEAGSYFVCLDELEAFLEHADAAVTVDRFGHVFAFSNEGVKVDGGKLRPFIHDDSYTLKMSKTRYRGGNAFVIYAQLVDPCWSSYIADCLASVGWVDCAAREFDPMPPAAALELFARHLEGEHPFEDSIKRAGRVLNMKDCVPLRVSATACTHGDNVVEVKEVAA